MAGRQLNYRVAHLPDPACAEQRRIAGGDVPNAVNMTFRQLLQAIARMPAGVGRAGIRMTFSPASTPAALQERLTIDLLIECDDDRAADAIETMLQGSPLGGLYGLKSLSASVMNANGMSAVADIHQAIMAVQPAISADVNYLVPAWYYRVMPFSAMLADEYCAIDEAMHVVTSPVIVEIAVTSVDMSPVIAACTAYRDDLHRVNAGTYYKDNNLRLDGVDRNDAAPIRTLPLLQQRDTTAEQLLHQMDAFLPRLSEQSLMFHVRVLACSQATARAVALALGGAAFRDGIFGISVYDNVDPYFPVAVTMSGSPRVAPYPAHDRYFDIGGVIRHQGLRLLANISTVDGLLGAFRLPVSGARSPQCIRRSTDPYPLTDDDVVVLGTDTDVGILPVVPDSESGRKMGIPRGVPAHLLRRHLSIFGMSGSYKSSLEKVISYQCHKLDIPVMTICAANTDHRPLKRHCRDADSTKAAFGVGLEVYTVGNDSVSPMRFNPMARIAGVSVEEQADRLLEAFTAAAPLPGPIRGILVEALQRTLLDHEGGEAATLADVATVVCDVTKMKGYSDSTYSDIAAAAKERIESLMWGGLGGTFRCRVSVPSIEHLLSTYSVIELDRMTDAAACTYVIFLLNAIRMSLRSSPHRGKKPRLVVIIDESHRVMGARTDTRPDPDVADPQAHAAALFETLLVELRSLGVAVVIADQHPTRVAAAVVQSTATQVALLQRSLQDCEVLAISMGLDADQQRELATLEPGCGFLMAADFKRAVRIRTPEPPDLYQDEPMSDAELLEIIRGEPWYKAARTERTVEELAQLGEALDAFEMQRIHVLEQLRRLYNGLTEIHQITSTLERNTILRDMTSRALHLDQEYVTATRNFRDGLFRAFMPTGLMADALPSAIEELRQHLDARYAVVVESGGKTIRSLVARFMQTCRRFSCEEVVSGSS